MKRGVIRTLLVIAISLFILIFPTCLHYYDLVEADFLCVDLGFENPDQEIQLMIEQNESKVFILNAFSIVFPLEIILFEQFHHFPVTVCSLDQKTSVLRC
jgi:hypothetical protein